MEPLKAVDLGDIIFEIHHDDCPSDPREWDNLGTMVCWHSRYKLGDKHTFSSPDKFGEWVQEQKEHIVVLSLYLYDHSGITISTEPFHCPWDSGRVGYIYASASKIIQEFNYTYPKEQAFMAIKGALPNELIERAQSCLRSEVAVYDQFLRGDVYGYVIKDQEGETKDSCWGFYGSDFALSGILECLDNKQREKVMEAGA